MAKLVGLVGSIVNKAGNFCLFYLEGDPGRESLPTQRRQSPI